MKQIIYLLLLTIAILSCDKELKLEEVLNADETEVKIDTALAWVHVLCTSKITFMYPHEKRRKEAMVDMGIIPNYSGILIHDHWKPYLGYDCQHGLCNAHHLRELQWVIDFKKQKWATSIKKFLNKLNDEVDSYGGTLPDDLQSKRETSECSRFSKRCRANLNRWPERNTSVALGVI